MKRIRFTIALVITTSFFCMTAPHTQALLKGFNTNCLDAKMAGADRAQVLVIPGKAPAPSKKTYLYSCSGANNICGAPSTDGTDINKLLFGIVQRVVIDDETGKSIMPIQTRSSIASGKNPTLTTANGLAFVDDPIVFAEYTKHGIFHRFYWVQSATDDGNTLTEPVSTLSEDYSVTEEAGSDGGLKLAQIPFSNPNDPEPTTAPTKVGATGKNCANIKWDPRGYVFDAETLNPVQNITITLFEKNKDGSYTQVPSGIGILNPYTTATDSGQFNFFVSPGLYKMTVDPKNATIAEKKTINPAYLQLFTDSEGDPHVYEKDTDVREIAGRVAVAHIPVTIQNKNLIIDTLQLLIKDAVVGINELTHKSQMHITGTVSHPKSILTITLTALNEKGVLITLPSLTKSTNDLGEYDFYIDQEQKTADGHPLYLQNINVRLDLNAFYIKQSSSKNKSPISYDVKPHPLYLEGVAYDTKGRSIPNAVVGIYPYFSEYPMYTVIADSNGNFQIGANHIPPMEYVLKYKTQTNEVVKVTPETFVQQNSLLYSKKMINPFAEKNLTVQEEKAMEEFVNKRLTDDDIKTMTHSPQEKSTPIKKESVTQTASSSVAIPVIVIIITLLILIVLGVFLAIRLRQRQAPPLQ